MAAAGARGNCPGTLFLGTVLYLDELPERPTACVAAMFKGVALDWDNEFLGSTEGACVDTKLVWAELYLEERVLIVGMVLD